MQQYTSRWIGANNVLWWNPTGLGSDRVSMKDGVPTIVGLSTSPVATLAHELAHAALDWGLVKNNGWGGISDGWFTILVKGKDGKPELKTIQTSDIYATHIENIIRSDNGLPLRTHYAKDKYGGGLGPAIIGPTTSPNTYVSLYYDSNGGMSTGNVTPYIYGKQVGK